MIQTASKPLSALVNPVTPESVANLLAIPYSSSDDDVLNAFISSASEIILGYTGMDFLEREWVYKVSYSDEYSTEVSPIYLKNHGIVTLPIHPVIEVTGVIEDGESVPVETDTDFIPCKVIAVGRDIEVRYTAGHESLANIPSAYLMGVKMLAGYLFENRGCDTQMAMEKSGAKSMVTQFKVFTL
jgi:hypothetical protein